MLDKSIPYKNIIMKMDSDAVCRLKEPQLPQGYAFRLYRPGDELHWARIETSVLEFDSEPEALKYFAKEYLAYMDELKRRCVFVTDRDDIPVATTTAWVINSPAGLQPSIHWVAVCPQHQGKGLGRAAVQKALTLFQTLHPGQAVLLHTQTWSHVAVAMYRSFGFRMMKTLTLGPLPNDFDEALDVLKDKISGELYRELINTAE